MLLYFREEMMFEYEISPIQLYSREQVKNIQSIIIFMKKIQSIIIFMKKITIFLFCRTNRILGEKERKIFAFFCL